MIGHEINGMTFLRKGEGKKEQSKGTEITLVAHGDGAEVIHHRLAAGQSWGLYPADNWAALETVTIVSGCLKMHDGQSDVVLGPGDTVYAAPVTKQAMFVAVEDTTFLYFTSAPIFHHYAKQATELMQLARAIEGKDGYTADHCERINHLSGRIGQHLNLGQRDLMHLNFGSFLHDIGKLQVPIDILLKPGKLTAEEWSIMRLHPVYGKEILISSGIPLLMDAASIVEYHHERYDGNGYFGLRGQDIPVGARIVAVVDSFDAMTSNRPYQAARSRDEAIEEITRCSGTWYDPDVVQAFLDVIS